MKHREAHHDKGETVETIDIYIRLAVYAVVLICAIGGFYTLIKIRHNDLKHLENTVGRIEKKTDQNCVDVAKIKGHLNLD